MGASRTRAFAAVIAVTAVGAFAATASASAPLHTRSDEEGIASEDTGSATAHCHPGENVVSGGFDAPGFDALAGPQAYTYGSRRVAGRGWMASAEDELLGGSVVAFAYCRTGRALKVRSANVTVPGSAGAIRSITAMCKPGEKVVSGGFDNPDFGSLGLFPFRSLRSGPRGWKVSAVNGRNGPAKLLAYAYCRKGAGVQTRADVVDVPPGNTTTATATARCKPGQRVVSGGFSNPTEDWSDAKSDLFYFSSHRSSRRAWSASAINFGATAGKLTAYAYCEPT